MQTIERTDRRHGPDSRNRLTEAQSPGPAGAHAALESFYYALNSRDGDALREVWTTHPLAQLNNPVGGILRGGEAIAHLYDRIFGGVVRVQVTFGDVVEYLDERHAVFAGREVGTYTAAGTSAPLEIRTTRFFAYNGRRWAQYHHHGSIDDAAALQAYQDALAG